MRIISGTAKGRKLLSPRNEGRITQKGEMRATRPTLDRVKVSMFNIINPKIYGARVLDMFAGTGSLGLECASRGADTVILTEKFKETYDILVENINLLGFTDSCKAYHKDSYEFIKSSGSNGEKFDIIFVDPPYLNNMVEESIRLIEKYDLLSENGVIVSKYDKDESIYKPDGKYELIDERKYGKTILGFYQLRI
ncbi:16S rRNA (guanine(966)-N(2))-methyltransferase RsmD [Proteiniclasticum sp. C24MP]|uniref:16S rRNA (guanine(966)-N(2))-methyltransferase RsmD n=1 Tax=Proteiniclasticum sp. C24MP TaxID=3374101 RepID=UPI0037544676